MCFLLIVEKCIVVSKESLISVYINLFDYQSLIKFSCCFMLFSITHYQANSPSCQFIPLLQNMSAVLYSPLIGPMNSLHKVPLNGTNEFIQDSLKSCDIHGHILL